MSAGNTDGLEPATSDDSPGKKPATRRARLRPSTIDRFVMPVVIALVAFAASYIAAVTANAGAAENQLAQVDEQRRKDAFEKRSEVYSAYFDAVMVYAPLFHSAVKCYADHATADSVRLFPAQCRNGLSAGYEAFGNLKQAINRIRIYGTREVYDAALALHTSLTVFEEGPIGFPAGQTTITPLPTPKLLPPPRTSSDQVANANDLEQAYKNAYGDYIRAMCAELSTDPAHC